MKKPILLITHVPSPNVEFPKFRHLTHKEFHAGTHSVCLRARLDTPPQGRGPAAALGEQSRKQRVPAPKVPYPRKSSLSWLQSLLPPLPGQWHSLTFQHNSRNFSPNRHEFLLQFNFWQELNENNAYISLAKALHLHIHYHLTVLDHHSKLGPLSNCYLREKVHTFLSQY